MRDLREGRVVEGKGPEGTTKLEGDRKRLIETIITESIIQTDESDPHCWKPQYIWIKS